MRLRRQRDALRPLSTYCDAIPQMRPPMTRPSALRHEAFPYRNSEQYVDTVSDFLREGLGRGEATMLAVPRPMARLVAGISDLADLEVVDLSELGRNPRRIIPAISEFHVDTGRRQARIVCEMQWPAQSAAEAAEATRQEAMINLALADLPITILCPYDSSNLADRTLSDAARTHPEALKDGSLRPSERFEDPVAMCSDDLWPLEPPPEPPERWDCEFTDLFGLRRALHDWATNEGLNDDRVDDLVLAVNELATNSILHGGGRGTASMWRSSDRLVCEVCDAGHITDPLVGSYAPGRDLDARGLWLVNHLCDLVEIRSGDSGTHARVTVLI
jgi:anti-sigma regulatory factor (Ser/Thr protein kinase)